MEVKLAAASEDEIIRIAQDLAQKRVKGTLAEKSQRFADRVFEDTIGEVRGLVSKLTEEQSDKIARAKVFQTAHAKLLNTENNPKAVELFIRSLISNQLVKPSPEWWHVKPADYSIKASIELAESTNSKRKLVLLEQINGASSINKLIQMGKSFIQSGLLWLENPPEISLWPAMCPSGGLSDSDIPSVLANAFEEKRKQLVGTSETPEPYRKLLRQYQLIY